MSELFSPARVTAWTETLLTLLAIVVVARLTLHVSIVLLHRTIREDDGRQMPPLQTPQRQAQVKTLVPLLERVLRYVLYFTAAVMILDRLHFNVAAILASAGIAGIAVGFGAQYLIRDIIAGFFLLFEGMIQVGDVIHVGNATGEVERVNLRTTQIRQFSGELVTIPNGEIKQFGNMSRGFMRAVVVVGLPYGANLQRAMEIMQRTAAGWAADHPDGLLGPPEVQGITELGATDVRVRVVIMVTPGLQGPAEREIRRLLLTTLQAEGIALVPPAATAAATIRST
jgi:small conductance mechanosensitive channel